MPVTLAPSATTTPLGSLFTATATVSNAGGLPVQQGVHFSINSGPNAGRSATVFSGRLSTVAYPNGVVSSQQYDLLGRLSAVKVQRGPTVLARYEYLRDAIGNPVAASEHGARTTAWTFDALDRLSTETLGASGAVAYGYDPVGNRLTRASTTPGIPSATKAYDANDRTESDAYDANGNALGVGSSRFSFDSANRLVARSDNGTSITYDANGLRAQKQRGAASTSYLWAEVNPTGVPQVVEELSSGTVSRAYAIGTGLVAERAADGTGASFFAADGIGNVRLLTDSDGVVTDSYDYDAFGLPVSGTGSTVNTRRFAGEEFDTDVGLYYLRSRYLLAEQGGFMGRDPREGDVKDRPSRHPYVYARNNPLVYRDPLGLQPFTPDIGYAVEDEVEPIYRENHPGEGDLAFGTWVRVPPPIVRIPLKPDIQNYTAARRPIVPWEGGVWVEIKPFSPTGIIAAGLQATTYLVSLSFFGFLPEVDWEPRPPYVTVPQRQNPLALFNAGGILFYSDRAELEDEIAVLIFAIAMIYAAQAAAEAAVVTWGRIATIAAETAELAADTAIAIGSFVIGGLAGVFA